MNSFFKVLIVGVVHILMVYVLYVLFVKFGITENCMSSQNYLNWDASWYNSIVENGYTYLEDQQSNSGFFPGFPYLWKILHLGPIGISFFNYFIFVIGLALLVYELEINWRYVIIVFSLPSLFFFYLPYTEALNYLFGSLLLISLWKNRWLVFYISLGAICLVRPQLFFLIPAVFVLFLVYRKSEFNLKRFLISSGVILTASIVTFYIIALDCESNDLMIYSKSQIENWNHAFRWPRFPLTTWRGYRMVWIDALAFFAVLVTGIYFLHKLINGLRKEGILKVDKVWMFAVTGLLMNLILVLFFHDLDDGRTTVLSLHRYVFCSPFLHYIILNKLFTYQIIDLRKITIYGSVSLLVMIAFGFPFYSLIGLKLLSSVIYLGGLFIVLMASIFIFKKYKDNIQHLVLFAVYVVGLLLQSYLFQSFLKGNWVG